MIFVTVGTHYIGFDRLIKKMDQISGNTKEKVIMQIGSTKYLPINAEYFSFSDNNEMINYIKKARLIVSHAGAGILLDSLYLKKRVIVVPRLKKYGEAIDNQQLDLATVLDKKGKIIFVKSVRELEKAISDAEKINVVTDESPTNLYNFLEHFMRSI